MSTMLAIYSKFRNISGRLASVCLLLAHFATPAPASEKHPAFIWYKGITEAEGFKQGDWFTSDFARKHAAFRTAWRRKQLQISDAGEIILRLSPADRNSDKDFFGGELQRTPYSHFGRYEVVMTAARGEGVISTFFTYAGPYFNEPHDEIDFEFLGKDTTKVWITRFADGQRLPGQWVELGFDAAEAPHLYAFEWTPERIVWYADGRELLRVEAADKPIPQTPGRVYINIWGGGEKQAKWSGVAPKQSHAIARYQCLSYVPTGGSGQQCSDRF